MLPIINWYKPGMDKKNTSHYKSALRSLLKNRWDRLPSKMRSTLETDALRQILEHEYFLAAQTVYLYAGDRYDLNICGIMQKAPDKVYAFPKVLDKTQLIFRQVRNYSDLKPGKFDILSPPSDSPEILPENTDLVIVPAQAADAKGYRLGRGAGYYDRVLAKVSQNTKLLCVIPFFARYQTLPVEAHDRPVHKVIVAAG